MQSICNKRLLRIAVGLIAAGVIAPLSAYGAADTIARHGPSAGVVIGVIVVFVLFYLAAVAVHEIGRLAACKLIGWNIYLIEIGPVLVRFEPFAVRLGRIPGIYSIGWVLAFPSSPEKQTKWRVALFNLTGVVANLISVVAAIVVLVVTPRSQTSLGLGTVVPIGLFPLLAALSSLFAAITLHQQTYKYRPLSRFGVARLKGLGLDASGITPGLWDSALIATLETGTQPDTVETDADARSADIFLYERYFALAEYEKARGALDQAISRTQRFDTMWDGVCIEDAFFSAFIEENIQHAQAALAKVNTVKVQHLYPYKRALAAIAILRGDHAGALRLLQRGPSRSGNPFSRQRVLKMHAMVVSKAQRAVS